MVRSVADWVGKTDLSSLGDRSLRAVNELLDRLPFLQSTNITAESLQKWVVSFAQRAGQWGGLEFLQGAAGGLFGGV